MNAREALENIRGTFVVLVNQGTISHEDIDWDWFETIQAALDANSWLPMRFLAYDSFNFIDDLTTPYDSLMKPATLREFKFDKHGRLVAYFTFDNGGTSSQFAENLRPLPQPPQERE